MKHTKSYFVKILIIFLLGFMTNACNQSQDEELENLNRFTGNVILNSQSDINEFAANQYKEITGYLYIGSYDKNGKQITPFNTDVSDIGALNTIERVRGDLFIRGNPILTELNGLENLKIVEGFLMKISLNSNLAKINGFNNLKSIGKMLLIAQNESLLDFCGLQNLMKNDFDIEYLRSSNGYNPTLEDIVNGNCSQ